jgi:RND family efflux transporter MFP subunit
MKNAHNNELHGMTILGRTIWVVFLAFGMSASGTLAQENTKAEGRFTSAGTGIVLPARSWDISAEVSNKINKLHFIEGQFVKKGDLLVEFDRAFKALDVRLAKTALAQANANLAKANENLARKKKLSEGVVSVAELRDAMLDATIAETEAEKAAIQLKMAELILSVQELRAPFGGQMTAPRYRENANVDVKEGHEIATLIQLDPVHIRIQGNYERLFAQLSAGESEADLLGRITLVLELPNGTRYSDTGRLLTSAFKFDPDTGLGTVIGEFPNPEHILRPGLKVKVSGYERRE